MPARSFFRDVFLLGFAAALGWWAHGANTGVQAQRYSTDPVHTAPDAGLSFQYGGLGPDGELTLYNSGNHTLYVYPSVGRSGNSHINCLYSVRVERAGAPLEREICPVGSFFPR